MVVASATSRQKLVVRLKALGKPEGEGVCWMCNVDPFCPGGHKGRGETLLLAGETGWDNKARARSGERHKPGKAGNVGRQPTLREDEDHLFLPGQILGYLDKYFKRMGFTAPTCRHHSPVSN